MGRVRTRRRRKSAMASIENITRVDMVKLEAALTAEAVKREYDSAAREFEAMGAELISAAKKCEALTADVQNTIRDTAEAYRQEGKKLFNRIEESALFTENVRKTCENAKRRMIGGNVVNRIDQ
jgi:hypothetical protein